MTSNRREFFNTSAIGCCGMALGFTPGMLSAERAKDTNETPDAEKVEFTKGWVERFFQVLDSTLDEQTRRSIMVANGRACYSQHQHPPRESKMEPAVFAQEMAKHVGEDNCYFDDNKIYFSYSQNPNGLKIADGFCLCPMVEDGPETLSPTYCYCSVGYVTELMTYYLGPITRVELLESLRSGGKRCRFLVHL